MDFDITWKYKDYELRKTTNPSSGDFYWELVKWNKNRGKDTCFTLAYFKSDSEGWELKFVGTRPFDYIDDEDLIVVWRSLRIANNALNEYFKVNRSIY